MYTIETFKDEKIAINCRTASEASAFMEICDRHGIEWCSGRTTESNDMWGDYKEDTCYDYDYDYDKKHLYCGEIEEYKGLGYKIIQFEDFFGDSYV